MIGRATVYSASWRGGAGWFVHELALSLAAAGTQVTLISPLAEPVERDPAHENLRRVVLLRGAGGQGNILRRISLSLWRVLSTFPILLRARLDTRNFVVTMTDFLAITVVQFLWIRLLAGKLIFIVHDVKPHAWAFPTWARSFEIGLLRWSYLLPTRLVTLTDSAKQQLVADFGIHADRISVIPHGAYELKGVKELPGNSTILVFGMLRRNKKILETIEAMRLLPPGSRTKLIIAGAPHAQDPEYWELCRRALEGLQHCVCTEIGFVPEDRVAELLSECDALVLPYDEFNSQSGVAILACLSERLILSTDAGGLGELQSAGLEAIPISRPVTAERIAGACATLEALSTEERRQRAHRSREALADHLSWSRIGREYQNLL